MNDKVKNIRFNYKLWIETQDGKNILGDGKWQLLKDIEETGSLKYAMKKNGWTYRKTWDNLKKIEENLGFPIIQTTRGGCDGGCTTLTDEGKRIVEIFNKFHEEYDRLFREMSNRICDELLDDEE
jgi:molybdate transport repressor ModE-like protein